MNVILLTKRLGQKGSLSLQQHHLVMLALFSFVVLPALAIFTGYKLAQHDAATSPAGIQSQLLTSQAEQQKELNEAKQQAQDSLNALAANVGRLQAHVMRLDALGERLTEMADIDSGEFNFSASPARGGPGDSATMRDAVLDDFMESLDKLSFKLEHRNQQLDVLEDLMMSRNLQNEVSPTGRPTKGGWLSSHFGDRTDPFTGKLAKHEGVDFAGKEGSEVIAVAAGIITVAEKRYGYGNLVEINHGNGYITRYGHNKEIFVSSGQTVKKGETLAAMGSTGRSTGPHVHFEVLYYGKPVNPTKYIYTASK